MHNVIDDTPVRATDWRLKCSKKKFRWTGLAFGANRGDDETEGDGRKRTELYQSLLVDVFGGTEPKGMFNVLGNLSNRYASSLVCRITFISVRSI